LAGFVVRVWQVLLQVLVLAAGVAGPLDVLEPGVVLDDRAAMDPLYQAEVAQQAAAVVVVRDADLLGEVEAGEQERGRPEADCDRLEDAAGPPRGPPRGEEGATRGDGRRAVCDLGAAGPRAPGQ